MTQVISTIIAILLLVGQTSLTFGQECIHTDIVRISELPGFSLQGQETRSSISFLMENDRDYSAIPNEHYAEYPQAIFVVDNYLSSVGWDVLTYQPTQVEATGWRSLSQQSDKINYTVMRGIYWKKSVTGNLISHVDFTMHIPIRKSKNRHSKIINDIPSRLIFREKENC